MQWHVDNKLDTAEQTDYPGLIFIFYLSDVFDGQFQLVAGSQHWSRKEAADFTDRFIETHHKDKIVDFKLPKGSLVVYTTEVIHRAHPIEDPGFERTSLFFQVERKERGGEPILVNTSFLGDLTEEKMYFLGFGATPEYEIYPQSGIGTMGSSRLLRVAGDAIAQVVSAIPAGIVWRLKPDLRAKLKRTLKPKSS